MIPTNINSEITPAPTIIPDDNPKIIKNNFTCNPLYLVLRNSFSISLFKDFIFKSKGLGSFFAYVGINLLKKRATPTPIPIASRRLKIPALYLKYIIISLLIGKVIGSFIGWKIIQGG